MTDPVLVAFIAAGSALGGALVGGAVSIAAAWIRARQEARQTRARLAVEAAMEEYRLRERVAGVVPPLGVLIFGYAKMLEAIEADELTRERMEEINALGRELMEEPWNRLRKRKGGGDDVVPGLSLTDEDDQKGQQ